MTRDYLVYDLEIARAIPDRDVERLEGIQYCEGWSDHAGMGVAVVAVYDAVQDRYRLFGADSLDEFSLLMRHRRFRVGWNTHRFDDLVLAAAGCALHGQGVDLLALVRESTGSSGWSLDLTSRRNLDEGKAVEVSAKAPILWQSGQVAKVADQALADVRLTNLLLRRVIETGHLIGPDGLVPVELPEGL